MHFATKMRKRKQVAIYARKITVLGNIAAMIWEVVRSSVMCYPAQSSSPVSALIRICTC